MITVYYFILILVVYNIPKVKSYFLHTWMSLDIWWPRRSKIQTTFESSIPANHFCVQAFLLASKTMNIMVIYQNKCFNLNYIPTKVYFLGWEKCLGAVRLMKSVIKYIYWAWYSHNIKASTYNFRKKCSKRAKDQSILTFNVICIIKICKRNYILLKRKTHQVYFVP